MTNVKAQMSKMNDVTNVKTLMTNQALSQNDKKKYDLEERTAKFGENIIDFAKSLDKNDDCQQLWREAQELTLIFSSILRSNNK